ncbi:hypothetical protein PanWU01x14_032810, partial [Parasponia andersonii]
VLSCILLKSSTAGELKGIKVSRAGSELTHALFTDDLLLCLQKFCNWSSQKINSQKSSIYFSKNTRQTKPISVNPVLGFQHIKENTKHPVLRKASSRTDIILWTEFSVNLLGGMTTLKLPKVIICLEVDNLLRRFWWGTNILLEILKSPL